MYVIKKVRPDGTIQYVASFKISNNGADIKYHSNPRYAMVFSDIPSAKALIQLAGIAFAAGAAVVDIVDFESCFTAADSNALFAGNRFDELFVDDIVFWGDTEWKVVKKDPESAKVYLMTRFCRGNTPYAKPTYNAKSHYVDDTGNNFRRSNLFTLCKYMHKSLEGVPGFGKLITTQSGFSVGVMTKELLETIPMNIREADIAYWTSSPEANGGVYHIDSIGEIDVDVPIVVYGFRPYICVNMGGE